METFELTLTGMANGGAALGRDEHDRVIFVPLAIPGERVRVELLKDRQHFAAARLVEVLEPSAERVTPPCPHYGSCGGCHFQHIRYREQIHYKEAVVIDQLQRIGRLANPLVRPTLAGPEPWAYAHEVTFYPTGAGGLGFWSSEQGKVIPIEQCHIIRPDLLSLFQDVDLFFPELRKLILRTDKDGALMAILESTDYEPPALEVDFPISAAILLPDGSAANLIGDNYLVQSVKGRSFRVSAGCPYITNPPAMALLIDALLEYAALSGSETVLELYAGVGVVTTFLASQASEVSGIEMNPDAVMDAAANLETNNNVTLYEGPVEEILPLLDIAPDVIVVSPPPSGLLPEIVDACANLAPDRLIYVSTDVATLARDGRRLVNQGFELVEVQPVDMAPQSFHTHTVSLWQHNT